MIGGCGEEGEESSPSRSRDFLDLSLPRFVSSSIFCFPNWNLFIIFSIILYLLSCFDRLELLSSVLDIFSRRLLCSPLSEINVKFVTIFFVSVVHMGRDLDTFEPLAIKDIDLKDENGEVLYRTEARAT